MFVKDWFLEKNFTYNERAIVKHFEDASVEKETEKAKLIKWANDEGIVTRRVPKTCILGTKEEVENRKDWEIEKMQRETERRKKEQERLEKGLNYNQLLVNFAKDNKIKGVRIGMKTYTLIKKIEDAGLTVPER